MRVTQSMLSSNMVRNLSNSYGTLGKLQEQLTSQKKFTKPSDDPVSAMMGMNYRTNLSQIQQYSSNIGEATSWLDSTDAALGEAVSAIQRIRELLVQASNGTYEENQRNNISEEIAQLKEHLVDIGDTQLGGKYIFNGDETNKRPSDTALDSELEYNTNEVKIEVFTGITISINTSGQETFGETLKEDGAIDTILTTIQEGDQSEVTNLLENVDNILNKFLEVQAKVGAKQNRIDFMTDRLSQQEVFAQKILSKNEDIDMEKTIVELTTQESIHTAALSVGSKIIQPSLMDFLR